MKKTILFVGYGGGHINMLIPVIKAVSQMKEYRVLTLALTTASIALERQGIPYIGYRDLLTEEDKDALKYGKALAKELADGRLVSMDETIAYLGLSFDDLVHQYGVERAYEKYALEGRGAFLPLNVARRFLDAYCVDLVVATNSPRTEQAFLLTAQERGVRSLCLVDLFDPRQIDDRLGQNGYGSIVCVFSDAVKKQFIDAGRNADEIVVTGNPDFDSLQSFDIEKAAAVYRETHDVKKFMVLWARQIGEKNSRLNQDIDAELLRIAHAYPDIVFVFRPHPNEPCDFGVLPANVWVSSSDEDVQVVLLACDLVLTITSTVGLQAVSCGIPLITFDMSPAVEYTPYSKLGFSVGVRQLSALESNIMTLLSEGSKKHVKRDSATSLVVDEILELLEDDV